MDTSLFSPSMECNLQKGRKLVPLFNAISPEQWFVHSRGTMTICWINKIDFFNIYFLIGFLKFHIILSRRNTYHLIIYQVVNHNQIFIHSFRNINPQNIKSHLRFQDLHIFASNIHNILFFSSLSTGVERGFHIYRHLFGSWWKYMN